MKESVHSRKTTARYRVFFIAWGFLKGVPDNFMYKTKQEMRNQPVTVPRVDLRIMPKSY